MYVVFSDLDGTLLDHDTYDYAPAQAGLDVLKKQGIPLVLVSSKTMPEMKLLHELLGLDSPYIFENGGGICWSDTEDTIEFLGMDSSELRKKKALLEETVGETVLFITDMSAEEIAKRTGLSLDRALLAQKRKASLPFIIPAGTNIGQNELSIINASLRRNGLAMTKGGRFYHFISLEADKGSAVRRVTGRFREISSYPLTTVGIGDSENDIAMFRAVDIPVTVRKKDATIIATGLDHVIITAGAGPYGFSEAIKKIIIDENARKGQQ